MMLAGLYVLLRGRLRVPNFPPVEGWQAQAVGLSLLLPLPLTALLGLVLSALINRGLIGFEVMTAAGTAEIAMVVGGLAGAAAFITLPEGAGERHREE